MKTLVANHLDGVELLLGTVVPGPMEPLEDAVWIQWDNGRTTQEYTTDFDVIANGL